jgi:glycosyltransferase involved in cell wall biosynthesis
MASAPDQPLVSVVIPTYNRGAALARALASVLQQTYRQLEIIVVDDASDHGTQQALAAVADGRVRLIRHRLNAGGASARNTGIDAAAGGLIAFLDSDDLWLPNKLARQVPFLLAQPAPAGTVCYTQIWADNGRRRFRRPLLGKRADEAVGDYLLLGGDNVIHTSTLLLARDLAAATRFEDGLRCHQDWDFCLRLERRGAGFAFLAEPLAIWQAEDRPDRMSRSFDPQHSLQWLERVRGTLSERAYLARRAQLAPLVEPDRWSALTLVLQAMRRGSLPPQTGLLLASRCISARLYRAIIHLLGKSDLLPAARRRTP